MIACLRFKRVRRLLHRYVVPGLCASAITLGGCAVHATTAPPTEQKEPVATETQTPITTVTAERAIQVGDVDAVYVTLTTFRPIVVSKAYAGSESGGRIEPLKLGLAIEKAGGAHKLLTALADRGFSLRRWSPTQFMLGRYAPLTVTALQGLLSSSSSRSPSGPSAFSLWAFRKELRQRV